MASDLYANDLFTEKNEADVKTSSSAVAERPRDASCLSVVSFSSAIRRALSFIISYFDLIYLFNMKIVQKYTR